MYFTEAALLFLGEVLSPFSHCSFVPVAGTCCAILVLRKRLMANQDGTINCHFSHFIANEDKNF